MELEKIDQEKVHSYYEKPRQDLTVDEIEKEYGSLDNWYANNARYVASIYNRGINFNDFEEKNQRGRYTNQDIDEIDQIIENYRYYLGNQHNFNYSYLGEDTDGNLMQAPFIKGQKVGSIIDYMRGSFLRMLKGVRVSVESISQISQDKRKKKIQKVMFKERMEQLLKEIPAVQINPVDMKEGDTMQDIIDAIKREPIDEAEVIGYDSAQDIMIRNNYVETGLRSFTDAVIGRFTGIHPFAVNGHVYWKVIPPYLLIRDTSINDDYNRSCMEVGYVEYLTPNQIFNKFPEIPADERKKINEMWNEPDSANVEGWFTQNSGHPVNFNWFNVNPSERNRYIAVVTTFWRSQKDPDGGMLSDESKEANPLDHSNGKHEGVTTAEETFRTATIVGNRFMYRYGEVENVIYDDVNKHKALPPVHLFIPNMVIGQNVSVVDRIRDLQDKMDTYEYKIEQKVGKDHGVVQIINGFLAGDVSIKDMEDNFKKIGIHVVPGVSGEEYNFGDNKKMIEVLDRSLDQSVKTYIELVREKERIMEEAVSVSKIALGQQRTYIGLGTQQNSINQSSSGMAQFYDGWMQFFTSIIQTSINIKKLIAMSKTGAEEAEAVFSDQEFKFIEHMNSKKFQFEDLLVRVDIEDLIDEQAKERIQAIALAMAQNSEVTGFSWDDYIDLETARTWTALKHRMKEKLLQAKEQKKKQEAMMQMMEEIRGVRQTQNELIKQQAKNQAPIQAAQIKADADVYGKTLEEAGKAQERPVKKPVNTQELSEQ